MPRVKGEVRTMVLEFFFGRPGTKRQSHRVILETDNPAVNLADAACYMWNLLNLGHRPPSKEVKVRVDRPVLWRKLRPNYYVKSMAEFREVQRLVRAGKKDDRFYARWLRK